MAEGQLHVHPDLLKVVEAVFERVAERVIGGLDVVNLKKCQEELKEIDIRARNAEQIALTYQEIARYQGDKIQWLENIIAELRESDTNRQVEIASLRAQVDRAS